jgi:hypothetical protein
MKEVEKKRFEYSYSRMIFHILFLKLRQLFF